MYGVVVTWRWVILRRLGFLLFDANPVGLKAYARMQLRATFTSSEGGDRSTGRDASSFVTGISRIPTRIERSRSSSCLLTATGDREKSSWPQHNVKEKEKNQPTRRIYRTRQIEIDLVRRKPTIIYPHREHCWHYRNSRMWRASIWLLSGYELRLQNIRRFEVEQPSKAPDQATRPRLESTTAPSVHNHTKSVSEIVTRIKG